MKILNLQLRFLLPLVLTLVAAAYLALPLMDQLNLRWYSRDLNARSTSLANAMSDSIVEAVRDDRMARLQSLFDRAVLDERLFAIGLCSLDGRLLRRTTNFPLTLSCEQARAEAAGPTRGCSCAGGAVHVGVQAVVGEAGPVAQLVMLHDLSFIDRRSQDTRRYLIIFIAVLGLAIVLLTSVVAHLSWRGWVAGVRGILRGEGLLRPLARAARGGAGGGRPARAAARPRGRLPPLARPQGEWDPARLRALLHSQLRGDQVIVVSNREPYIHEQSRAGVVVKRPASGLVTAVEPVMRACSGTWIAHGSGSADRKVVDRHDRVDVPPDQKEYTLRRIWLTPEETPGAAPRRQCRRGAGASRPRADRPGAGQAAHPRDRGVPRGVEGARRAGPRRGERPRCT